MSKNISKNGFTLTELAIVLVVAGLLLGGLLVGQSLISSAKIQGYVADLYKYESVVDKFEDKYFTLPGDEAV